MGIWKMGRALGPIRRSALYSHGLDSGEFTSDTALASLIDRYPAELVTINFREGLDAQKTSFPKTQSRGAALLEAVRQGHISVSLSGIEDQCLGLWSRASDAFGDVISAYPKMHVISTAGELTISTPGTHTPYHFDPVGVVLFHMRGLKRVFVYPTDERHLPEAAMEDMVTQQRIESLPYDAAFDHDAQVFELHPGEALAWPLYAPHRVEVVGGLCVSLAVEYQTWASRAQTGTLYTHACMRARGMTPPAVAGVKGLSLALKWALSLPLRRINFFGNRLVDYPM